MRTESAVLLTLPIFIMGGNVALPLIINDARLNAARAKAKNLLALVGLSDWLVHWPDGLSDEQQQRAAIAHALINEAPRLSANEPIGNLDSHTGEEILRHIGQVRAKMRSWCDTCTAPNAVLFAKIEGSRSMIFSISLKTCQTPIINISFTFTQ